MSPSSARADKTPAPVPSQRKRVFWYASAFAVVALVLNLVVSALPGRRSDDGTVSIARLLVPAAQSAQAFSLEPVKSTAAGIDPNQGWTLRTSVPASAEAIQRAIKVQPPVAVNVEKVDDRSWRVTPVQTLDTNTVYKVTLATALQNGTTETPYEYSWVNQTAGTFQVEAMTPAPGAAGVPSDTAIEWTFSQAGFTNAESFVQITPAVEGRYEVRDRTLIFMPTKPLKAGQVYKLRLKAGLGLPGTPDSQLKKDMEYAFQVANDDASYVYDRQLFLPVQQQVATNKRIEIPFVSSDRKADISLEVYRLTVAEAETYLRERSMRFGTFTWQESTQEPIVALLQGKTPVNTYKSLSVASRAGRYGGSESFVTIPTQGAGFFLVRATAPNFSTDFSLVQSSDLAVHAITDSASGAFWVMNAQNRQPISGATVRIGEASTESAADGLARLNLPADLVKPDALQVKTIIARVQAQGQETLVEVDPVVMPWWHGSRPGANEGLSRTWSYLYVDRAVQRQADTLNVFGLALDRTTKQPINNLKLRLTTNDYRYRFGDGYSTQTPTLQEQSVVADAYGRFQASFSWSNLQASSYQVELLRDGKAVDSQYFSVKEDVKPRMVISIELDKEQLFAGDTITGKVKTTFADGTSFPNADVSLSMVQSASYTNIFDRVLTTDGQGEAVFRVPTNQATDCTPVPNNAYFQGDCYATASVSVYANSATGEEGESAAYAQVALNTSSVKTTESEGDYGSARLTWNQDGSIDLLGKTVSVNLAGAAPAFAPQPNQLVNVDIHRVEVKQTQTGTRYDEVEKKTIPVFTETRSLVLEKRTSVTSDANGNLGATFAVNSTSSEYQVLLSTVDGRGRKSFSQSWMPYRGANSYSYPGPVNGPQDDLFSIVRVDEAAATSKDPSLLNLNQRVRLALRVNDEALSTQKYSKPLFVVASRGIVSAAVSASDAFDMTFDERTYPNATVYGIVFTDHGFERATGYYYLNNEPYTLTVQATTDKEEYGPQGAVIASVKVLDVQGRPVAGAKVAVSTADLMLESLGAFPGGLATPVQSIYRAVEDGVQGLASTHESAKAMNGGAEGGGGAGDQALLNPRKDFKDQANFQVIETDATGSAMATFTMPDNITTWRMEFVAVGKDLQAGAVVLNRPATKALSIDAVVPKTLQVGDRAEIKLRPIANELTDTTELTYAVTAPTLGLAQQTFKAKGRASVYVPITATEQMVGTHRVQVGVISGGRQDAMEFTINVEERGYTKTIWEQAQATDGFRLPGSLAPASTVIISSSARSTLLSAVQDLLNTTGSSRLESLLAARMANELLPHVGVSTTVSSLPAIDWTLYQLNGGLKPLPQSSEGLETSFNAAFSGQNGLDRNSLIVYFRNRSVDKTMSREQRLLAVAGLGVLGQPVLPSLQAAAAQTDLSFKEQVTLVKAFVAMGNRDGVKTIFDGWMTKAQEIDGRTFVNIDTSETQRFEATRVALLAAGFLSDDRFAKLAEYVSKTNFEKKTFDPILDARITALRVAQAPQENARVTYRIGDLVQEVDLKDGPAWVGLTATTWSLFSIDKVEGPVTVQWSRRVPGLPEPVAGLGITRTIVPVKAGELREGDTVRITLTPAISSRGTFACYEVRDRLPANLRALISWQYVEKGWMPSAQTDGEVRFTTCSGYDPITYTAQIISAGSYAAPSTLIQNIDQPSLAAIGKETTLTTVRR